MARIAIHQEYTPVEVDLWGTVFETVAMTKKVIPKWSAAWDAAVEAEQREDFDGAVKRYGEALDVRLKPTGGGRKKPSAVLVEQWDAQNLTLAQLGQFLGNLAEADSPN